MSIDKAVRNVLERLSDGQVEDLVARCELQASPPMALGGLAPGAPPGAQDAIAQLASEWALSSSMTGEGVALALRIGLGARRQADARRSRPVWTGPGATGEQRLTAGVLHQLLAMAEKRILLVSFAAFTLTELAADLEEAVRRGCDVDVVFETEEDSAGAYSGPDSKPFGMVEGIRRWRWPGDQRPAGAVLHAKLLVIDGRQALIGSANLTRRALTANLEAGVLVGDPDLAAGFEEHIRRLISSGVLLDAGHSL